MVDACAELADRVEAGIGKDLMGWTAEVVPLKQSKE